MASDLACPPASELEAQNRLRIRSLDRLLLLGLLAAVTVAVYWQVVGFRFLTWDDDVHVTNNPTLNPVSLASLEQIWLHPYEYLYIPASYTLFAAEAALSQLLLGRLDAGLFHAGSLVLHLACVALVFRLLTRLLANPLAALAGAACFAIHPLQVESVAWISETRGLLGTCFSLAALCWYLPRNLAPGESSAGAGRAIGLRRYMLATAMFVLALLSKPSTVAVPLVAMAIDWLWLERPLKRSIACLAPWMVLALLDVAGTKLLQSDERIVSRPDWYLRPLVACDAISFYLRKLMMPTKLGFVYGRTPATVLDGTAWRWAWALPTCVLMLLLVSPARRKWLAVAAVFVAGLLPVLGFVPFMYQDISTVADRYMYFPMLGAALALGFWLDRHWSRPMFAAACVMLGAYGQSAWLQTSFWRDDITLFSRGVEINRGSCVAQYMLGTALNRAGRPLEAQDRFRAALAINPKYYWAHNDLAASLLEQGNTAAALGEVEAALAIAPDYAESHVLLGNVFARLQKTGQAEREYRMALEKKPTLAAAELNWGTLRFTHGRVREAIVHFRRAIELKPNMAAAHFRLGEALIATSKLADAQSELLAAIKLDPELAAAHNNLGNIYLRQQKLAQAAEEYDAALAIDPELVESRFNRGLICLEQGDTVGGMAAFRGALQLLPDDSPQAAYIREELKKYEGDAPVKAP